MKAAVKKRIEKKTGKKIITSEEKKRKELPNKLKKRI